MPDLSEEKLQDLRRRADQYAATHSGYHVEHLLGAGGSAAVFRVDTPAGLRALKVYDPLLFDAENRVAEIHRLALQERLINTTCTSLANTFSVTTGDDSCFIEMEYVPWPQLKQALHSVTDDKVQSLILQLVNGVRHLEAIGLVHRDIKPENILVSPDFSMLKVIDYGVVRDVTAYDDGLDLTDHGVRRPFLATAQYSSPEYLFRLAEPSAELWKGLTIYQVGAVLHDLLVKRPLFDKEVQTKNRFILAMAVLRSRPALDDVAAPELAHLKMVASNCLVKDLKTRLALVDWNDFEPPTVSPLEKLRRTLGHRRALAALEPGPQTVSDELRLKRGRRVLEVFEATRSRLVAELSGYVKFGWEAPKDLNDDFSFTAHLPDTDVNIGNAVHFEWGAEDQSEVASVFLEINGDVLHGESRVIGTADLNGGGQHLLIEAICNHAADSIMAALT